MPWFSLQKLNKGARMREGRGGKSILAKRVLHQHVELMMQNTNHQ
jgi:hypothetical protein